MPRVDDDVPQTIGQAVEWGWSWLSAKCRGCRHHGQIKFAPYLASHAATRLSLIAGKVVCSKCRSRLLDFGLGTYITGQGQPRQESRQIAFVHGETVKPTRD